MKNLILTLVLIFQYSAIIFSQIPNSGFESWTSVGTHNNPNDWGNLNGLTESTNVFTCLKGTPGSPGLSYLKLISKSVPGMGILPGVAVSGKLDTVTFKPISGFPYTDRPQSLKGKWQHMSGSDQGYIDVLLTAWNSSLQKRDTIAYKHTVLGFMVMSWANFTIGIDYMSNASPDSAIIFFSASPSNPEFSDYLYIDNLSFSGTVTGISKKDSYTKIFMFPNPVFDNLNFLSENNSQFIDYIEIYDILGNQVLKIQGNKSYQISVNSRLLSKGAYIAKIFAGHQLDVQRFVKQ